MNSKYPRVACSFELSQKRTSQKGVDQLNHVKDIGDFLKVSVNPIRGNRAEPLYRIRTSTVESNTILSSYLARHPL